MNIKLVLPVLLSLIFLSCKEEKQIEIIPNLEAEYLSESEVDKPAEFISGNDDSANDSRKDLIDAIKSIHDSQTKDSIRYIIKLRFYISDLGKIQKVKDISNIYDRTEYSTDGVKNYLTRDKMNEALALELANLGFEPAIKDGKNVKSWIDVKGVNVLATPDGKFQIEMPDFLSGGMFGSKDEYLIAADEMPEIIGGFFSIQKNIKYPELAKRAGIEGKVYVLALINEEGNVVNARVIKGIGAGCDEAALEAVKGVKFTSARKDGKPVKVQVTIPIAFKLQ
jgi:TonB family protein